MVSNAAMNKVSRSYEVLAKHKIVYDSDDESEDLAFEILWYHVSSQSLIEHTISILSDVTNICIVL